MPASNVRASPTAASRQRISASRDPLPTASINHGMPCTIICIHQPWYVLHIRAHIPPDLLLLLAPAAGLLLRLPAQPLLLRLPLRLELRLPNPSQSESVRVILSESFISESFGPSHPVRVIRVCAPSAAAGGGRRPASRPACPSPLIRVLLSESSYPTRRHPSARRRRLLLLPLCNLRTVFMSSKR